MLAGDLVISEILAINDGILRDEDGEFPDWVEVHNPTTTTVDLDGWHLTDDADELTKWEFPDVSLDAGGYLVVFASGKDRHTAGDELHTNFQLAGDGEFLALTRPDGETISHQFAPEFPKQAEDISFGLGQEVTSLVSAGAAARTFVPINGDLGTSWTARGFNDNGWISGATGIGYEVGDGQGGVIAYANNAGNVGSQNYGGSLGLDFFVSQIISVTKLGVFDSGSDGLNRTITAQMWRRSGNGGTKLAELVFTPADAGVLVVGDRFKPLPTPLSLTPGDYTIVAFGYGSGEPNGNQGGPTSSAKSTDDGGEAITFVGGGRFGAAGQFPGTIDGGPANRYSAGTFEFAAAAYTGLIETDLEAAMQGAGSTAYTRIEFDSADPAEFSSLALQMQYDDGFVAYLNGTEVARRNVPQDVLWNSTASSDRPLEESLEAESINITQHLSALREGNNVLAIAGLNVNKNDNDFLIRPELVAAGLPGESLLYFDTPTPGGPNHSESSFTGFISNVRFSVERGFFDDPFSLELSTKTEAAEIRYTTDGSPPTASTGEVYQGPILINGLTTLRAAAFKDTLRPSDVMTQSYLFLDDVLAQAANQTGYPSFDFAMDQDAASLRQIVGDSNATTQQINETIKSSLLSLPTMSITMSVDDFFGSGGIYRNPQQRGLEKPASIEYILPDGSEGFQINAGLRIMGGTSRNPSVNVKHSLRILFKKEYGKGRLRYQFFPDSPIDNFNTIALRANARDSWSGDPTWAGADSFYIRDQWAKVAQRDMGAPATSGNFVHLYINGLYWGLYNPTERPDAAFAEQHFGDEDSNYDAVKFCCGQRPVDGDVTKWNELLSRAQSGVSSNAAYESLLGNNPDGTRNPDTEVLLDVDNLIDYVIAGQYHASADWPGNYYVSRLRGADSTGFRFFTWDNDLAFVRNGNITVNADKTRSDFNNWWTESPGVLDIALRANAEYRLRFADRVHTQYFNGGSLMPAATAQRWIDIADQIRESLVAESVRWGDNRGGLLTPTHWETVNQRMLNNYFPQRSAIVLNQMRSRGLYPSIVAPAFNQHGGAVEAGFNLSIAAPAGTIYYTLDGSDPRLRGGAISPTALRFEGDPIELSTNTAVKSRVRSGSIWSALNQATFFVDPATAENLAITEINYNPLPPTPAELAQDETWLEDDFEFIELMNVSARSIVMAGVRFTSGMQFEFTTGAGSIAPGDRIVVVNNLPAFRARYGDAPVVAGQFTSGRLSNKGEKIEVIGADGSIIRRFKYDDSGNWPGRADGRGATLELIDPAGDYEDPNNWRSSIEFGGTPGTAGEGVASGIVVNEVLTHTDLPQLDAIELFNPTDRPIDVGGWFISDTGSNYRKFRIPSGTVIADGGYLVLDERDFNPSGGIDPEMHPNDFALDSSDGDDVWLLEGDSQGRLIRFVDHVEFDAAANGVSFGRFEKSTGKIDFTALERLTLGEENSGPRVGPVVIHEIMYNPDADGTEFIELKNISGIDVPLFDPQRPQNTWRIGGVNFDLPGGLTLAAGSIALIVPIEPEEYRVAHAVPDDVLVLGPYLGRLDNGGERITLWRPDEPQPAVEGATPLVPMIAVDSVRYNDRLPWPEQADGQGASLQRLEPIAYANDPASWIANFRGGTPGDEPPRVSEVLLFGSSWSASESNGYSISSGAAQLIPAATSGVDQIRIRFTNDVRVSIDDLTVTGVNRTHYEPTGFSYDAQEFLASWSFDGRLQSDKLQLELDDRLRDTGGRPLDGNWTDAVSKFPSGDGLISANDPFRFRLNVVPGDVDANALVDRRDLLDVIHGLGGSVEQGRYDPRLDVNVDGQIDADDLRAVLARLGSQLPPGEPASAADPPATVAVDALFARAGAGAAAIATTGGQDDLLSASRGEKRIRKRAGGSVLSSTRDSPLRRLQATSVDAAFFYSTPILGRRIIGTARRRR